MTAGAAVLSPCGRYRYRLVRGLEPLLGGRTILYVMLNPSTADADTDDPTIRKCIGFAKRLGGVRVEVVNLYALRATDPRDLRWCIENEGPSVAVGPDNDRAISAAVGECIRDGGLVLAAWGAHPTARRRVEAVSALVTVAGADLYCLGVAKDGSPRHPLMLGYDAQPVRWIG